MRKTILATILLLMILPVFTLGLRAHEVRQDYLNNRENFIIDYHRNLRSNLISDNIRERRLEVHKNTLLDYIKEYHTQIRKIHNERSLRYNQNFNNSTNSTI